MKRIVLWITLAAIALSAGHYCTTATAGKNQALREQPGKAAVATGIQDQRGVALTIYNSDLGLVKDTRSIRLADGVHELRFMDVATGIIPTSVHIKSLTSPGAFQVLEQNYEYDLLSPARLLDKYVGKEVKLATKDPDTGKEKIVTATLLSNNDRPVFKIGNDITFDYPGRIIFPGVPENLISKPTLVWLVKNSGASQQDVEASYLTNGINWSSDYVVTLNDNDDRADLTGWVTIDNRSGATYKDASLKLVAGDVNRVSSSYGRRENAYMEVAPAASASQFKENAFFEYHLYTLQRPATIKDNQTKQISLVQANNIKVKEELIYEADPYYYRQYMGQLSDQKVGAFIEITNNKDNGLGIPLPKGTIRVYKKDKDRSLQFIGEDTIDHTPKDEKFRIKLGDAFDVVAGRKTLDWKKLGADTYEATYEISLRNHKEKDVTVRVIEPIAGDWTILGSSHAYKKTDASTAEFDVRVPNNKEVKVTYTVLMRF